MSKSKILIENELEQQGRSLLLFRKGELEVSLKWKLFIDNALKKKKYYREQSEVCRAMFLKAWRIDDALMSWGRVQMPAKQGRSLH